MGYFVSRHSTEGRPGGLWMIGQGVARTLSGARSLEVGPNDDPMACAKAAQPGWDFVELKLAPGEFYSRMARPQLDSAYDQFFEGWNPDAFEDIELLEASRGQLIALREQLERIFRTVQPVDRNFGAFGHDIRNVLILAATEVEAHWKGILKAHNISSSSTNDYVRLLAAMKLDQYSLHLPYYPSLANIAPFQNWSLTSPTRSLRWYDAYNAVKHDRESEFQRATLLHATEAVCACAVLIAAQFGRTGFQSRQELSHFFVLRDFPRWELSECYSNAPGHAKTSKVYPF